MVRRMVALLAFASAGCGGLAVVDGSAGEGGAGSYPSCAAVEAAYGAALSRAKQCDPLVNSLQCTQTTQSALTCGCSTYVNPDNSEALAALGELESAWQAMGCDLPTPCPFGCPAPQGSACVPDGADADSGSCEDLFL